MQRPHQRKTHTDGGHEFADVRGAADLKEDQCTGNYTGVRHTQAAKS